LQTNAKKKSNNLLLKGATMRGIHEEYCHKVQYYETDQMQIVHHSNYIRWFEEARTFYMEQIGFGYDRMEKENVSCPVLEVFCEYLAMVRFPEMVIVRSRMVAFTGIRMMLEYEIIDSNTRQIRAKGHSKHCFIGVAGRPISLQKENKELYSLLQSHFCIDTEA
jgi:acyl-CoA thioester hydrolase